jgi:hypothetical protein
MDPITRQQIDRGRNLCSGGLGQGCEAIAFKGSRAAG